MSSTVYIVGATSILGWSLTRVGLQDHPGQIVPTCSAHNRHPRTESWLRLNVEDRDAWAPLFGEHPVDTLIYAAGVCDVDRCEEKPDFAWSINVGGVEAMLRALPSTTRLLYCSSDHVFGGRDAPYLESDAPAPISAYGRTRAEAEARVLEHDSRHLVVRLGLTIGPSLAGRTGHLDWLRYRHEHGLPMTLIEDEWRSAVWAEPAVRRIFALARSERAGVQHLAARALPRPELARRLARRLGIEPEFRVQRRAQQITPHLGKIELGSMFDDPLAAPLPGPGLEAADG
ncbi:MAG: sugar nucleotide-binding protein [Myxococcota bacterium]